MKKWLLRTFYAFLCLGVGAAYADYNATQGTGSVVFAFVCFTTKICPAHVLTNSSGTEIATTSNPVQVGAPASAMTDGWDATQGTKADTAYTSGSGSVISILKGIFTAIGSAIPSGTNIIGKVGIDQTTPGTTNGVNVNNTVNAASTGVYFTNVASSVLTRPANTTAYSANETVCQSTSAACTPLTIAIGATNGGKGLINRVSLLKSGSSTTNASFTIWLFSAAPGLATPTQEDATAYSGPRAGDMPNYIGNAVCAAASGVATSDTSAQVWYECTLSNPNTAGALDFQALSGSTNINALISVTAAYTPASAETFTVYASGIY